MTRLRSAFVIVVGCGGVGSHATAALARSGVLKLRLIDFDQVSLSSLNRHAVATLADVGTPKVHCLRKRLEQVTPWVHFDPRNELFSEQAADRLLAPWTDQQPPDYVIDAIDNIDSKVALLSYCHSKSLRVVSSMGAGCKSDPSRLFVGDISTSLEDPLSRSTRRRLRALGIEKGIPVVYSNEKPGPGKAQLLPLPNEEFQKGQVDELSVLPDFRVRILPVLGTMPAIFGYAVANHVILDISGYPHDYVTAKGREKLYDGILGSLQGLEDRLAKASIMSASSVGEHQDDRFPISNTVTGQGDAGEGGMEQERAVGVKIPVTKDDVGFLVDEVYRGKSILSGITTRLTLIRWRKPPPTPSTPPPSSSSSISRKGETLDRRWPNQISSILSLSDLVCVTKEEAVVHERDVLRGEQLPEDRYDSGILRRVQGRRREIEEYERFR